MSRRPASPAAPAPAARLLLGALLLAALGCGDGERAPTGASATASAAGSDPVGGGTLVVGIGHDLPGVNYLLVTPSGFTRSVYWQLFLRLFEEQADYAEHPPTMAPQLVERYDWSDDRLTLTLHLRDDVEWSDGVPLTAEDVRWTWLAQTDPAIAWPYAYVKESIEEIRVVGPHVAEVRYREVSPSQLADLNEGVILPRHAWGKIPFERWRDDVAWFRQQLVVSGPFKLEREPGVSYTLVRNERYHRPDLPYLDRVVFLVVPDKSVQVQRLLAGGLDYVTYVSPSDARRVAASERNRLIDVPNRQYNFICWNLANPLFERAEVRRALTLAIDRQALIDAAWFGYAELASSPIPSGVWAHNDDFDPWPFDPQAARDALAAAGWTDADGDGVRERAGQPFRFKLSTNADSAIRREAAVLIQDHLRRVGVEAEIELVELNALIAMNESHRFDATLGAWGIDTSLDLEYAFHSDSIDGGQNYGGYSNPEVDRLIEAASAAPDVETLVETTRRIQAILHQDQPYTFLWEPRLLIGASRELQGAQPNALSTIFHLEEWWLSGRE